MRERERESYEAIRVGARYDQVLKNIAHLIKIKKEVNSQKPRLRWNYTIIGENINELADFVDMIINNYEAKVIQVRIDSSLFKKFPEKIIKEWQEKYKNLIKEISKKCQEKNIELFCRPNFLPSKTHTAKQKYWQRCVQPWYSFYPDAEGNLKFCLRYSFGNLKQQSLDEIIASEKMQKIRQDFINNRNDYCRNCSSQSGSKRGSWYYKLIET